MKNLSTRPLSEEDIPFIVNYWFQKSDAELIQVGADKTKFSTADNMHQSLKEISETPLAQAKTFYMTWLVDNKPIGYSALKDIAQSEIACIHLHMWSTEHQGKGYGGKLFCQSAVQFYDLFKPKLILCEPKATNPMPNKMLTKVGFKKWRTYFSASSEIALPSDLNSYLIDLKTATDFLNR